MDVLAAFFQSLGIVSSGIVVACLGLLLLGQFRDEFLKSPRRALSPDMLARIGQPGGPRYSGVLLLCSAGFLIVVGLARSTLLGALYLAHALSLIA